MSVVETIKQIAQPVCDELGLELWDVEFKKEGADFFLRVFIDKPDGGIFISDCENVNNILNPILDELDPIEQSYYFEVSSAGAVRELKEPFHFDRYLGKPVSVHMYKIFEGFPKQIECVLLGYDNDNMKFEINSEEKFVPRSLISKISIDLL